MRYFSNQVAAITKHVYLSSVGGVTQERSLDEHGITHILNVAMELKDLKYPREDLKVKRVSLRDAVSENILPHLEYLVDHVHEVACQGGRVAVHCIAGVSRSATVCIAYLVKHHHMTLKQAYQKVYKAREVIYPNNSFWASLVAFEKQYQDHNTVEMLPYICGMVPSVYQRDTEIRIRHGWMGPLCVMWVFHMVLTLLQVYFA
ncbi:dual specificity protein phosphatase 18-like [Haliotis rubra]|uniref:dual specificity protein phosphatase 18-like n=1 Tax=Haliotis rubra TaxID=36100 RepID=UPI001EE5E660|nr:dual specificity protein phosphatase 18-like [Haliotis rubra]XP_046582407.1 dual specificity protein phosphatase 18-like [Haliotis rubra]XP_046582408.1 dual specificity protein phosphatase 18-like [Haliotis rubra]XP_046582409.1 dual specificity protein phosphatase 18-like [Haliotis rubra]